MASPFHVFRKHQKIMIATLGLAAMIAFVFLDFLGKSRNPSSGKNPVVVTTTKYGNLQASDLIQMQEGHKRLLGFLRGAVIKAGGEPMFIEIKLRNLERIFGNIDEEAMVDNWLMTLRAKELGMVVTDQTIKDFLGQLTEGQVSKEDLAQLCRQFGLSQDDVFRLLENEFLSMKLQQMFQGSLLAATPAQRWDYYQRLHRNVSLEVAPVEVAQFVDQVPDPGDSKLQEFFEKHKNEFTLAGSPKPGFRVPKKVAVEYVKAEYEKFANPAEVTDEEIEQYYKENLERFRNIELPGMEFEDSTLDEPAATDVPPPESGEAKGEEEPKANIPEATLPETQETPSEKTEVEQPESSEPAPAKEDVPATEPPAEEPAPRNSRTGAPSTFRFVSMTQEAEKKIEEPKP
ncbi:MAG: hypothetical protein JW888_14815, partial [Pirellulales bacterium]|nr:hypothetical protein [Pirellulales bacterium]